MRLSLFASIAGQHSMCRYGEALQSALRTVSPVLEVDLFPGDKASFGFSYVNKYLKYQRAVRQWAGDVNHVIDHGYAHLLTSLPSGSTVVTVHDLGPLWKERGMFRGREGSWLTSMAFRWSLRAMRRAAKIVAVSEATRRDLLELTGWSPERVSVIYSGIEKSFAPVQEPMRRLEGFNLAGRRFILHVGGSTARKNIGILLRAMKLVDDSVQLVKAGAGLEAPERSLMHELGLQDRVIEIGPVSDEVLPSLYSAAEALVFPSVYEGFGWPPLEAMACGTPAVISGIPSLREIAGPGAVMVDSCDDATGFAEAIGKCLRGYPGREELVARGRQRVAGFSWTRTAEAYLKIYNEIAEERAR